MLHKGTVTLETGRLLLRQFTMEDAESMYRNWASEDAVTKYLTWPPHSNVEVTKAVLRDWVEGYQSAAYYHWAIALKETGELIGSITVVKIQEKTAGAELGYCIGSRWWGRELMPEAGRAVVRYLFESVGFRRIAATHARENLKSGRVMQKIGMKYEGTLRQAGFCNQGVVDEVWYSILKDEYDAACSGV